MNMSLLKKNKKQERDPQKTRATILSYATQCFAKAGFHGTTLEEILKKAKVNKRMIYHYFGNKQALYKAVHFEGWQELGVWFGNALNDAAEKRMDSSGDQDLLLEAIAIFHDFMASHQLFLRLLVWDGLEGGRMSRSLWKDIRGPLYIQMESLVVHAQERGVLSSTLKPGHLIISFMGAISFYFSHAHTMGDIFQKNPLSKEAILERREQILKLFEQILGSSRT